MKGKLDYFKIIGILLQIAGIVGAAISWALLSTPYFEVVLFLGGTILLFLSNSSIRRKVRITAGLFFLFLVSAYFQLLFLWIWRSSVPFPEECEQTNPVFETYTYETKEYRNELISLLNQHRKGDLTYWFRDYENDSHISVFVRSEHICAIAYVTVNEWTPNIAFLKERKGWTKHPEVYGLELDLKSDSTNPQLIYAGMIDIVN
jgi:hypothetical protein